MGKHRYRKLYLSDLEKEIKYEHGEQFLKDFKETYYWTKLRSAIFESRDLYFREYNTPTKGNIFIRLTFPLFVISVFLVAWVGGAIKWVLTGNSEILKHKSKVRSFFEMWNDKGGFDLL